MTRSNGSTLISIGTPTSLPWLYCSDPTVQNEISNLSLVFACPTVDTARMLMCVYCHHGSISCCTCTSWGSWFALSCWYRISDCWCVWKCLRSLHPSYPLPQIHVCITRCSSRSFSSTRQYILSLSPTNSMMRCPLCSSLKMGFSIFLLKLRNDESEGNFALVNFLFEIVHELSIEVTRVIQFREIEWLVHLKHLVNDVALVTQLYNEWISVLSQ